MRRRAFLRTLGVTAALSGVQGRHLLGEPLQEARTPGLRPPDPTSRFHQTSAFQRWTWVHGGADRTFEEWRRQFGALARAGFTGVLVGGGDTETLAAAAHDSDLEFHRWIWTLNRNGDAWVKEHHPEWFTMSRRLESSLEKPPYVGYYRWLCPTRAPVKEYLRDSILNIAQDPRVDGIHLDYIRHCDVILPRGLWSQYDLIQDKEYPEFDFCYCDACRGAFSSRTGTDPLDLPDPTLDEEWRRFRWESVTELVNVLAEAVHSVPVGRFQAHGDGISPDSAGKGQETGGDRPSQAISVSVLRPNSPGKPISAAVFPTPSIAKRLVRQAWDEWPLDAFFPMLYHEFYEEDLAWIRRGIEEGLGAIQERIRPEPAPNPQLFAGLYLPTLNRDGTREKAAVVAQQAGAQGVSFFEMNGLGLMASPDSS